MLTYRESCQRQHLVLGHLLKALCEDAKADGVFVRREFLAACLGAGRITKVRTRRLEKDLADFFPDVGAEPIIEKWEKWQLEDIYVGIEPGKAKRTGWLVGTPTRSEIVAFMASRKAEKPLKILLDKDDPPPPDITSWSNGLIMLRLTDELLPPTLGTTWSQGEK